MMKKTISILLCCCFLIPMFSLGVLNAYAAETSIVHIFTESDLIAFSNKLASGQDYFGKTVYLENDLVINEGDLSLMSQAELDTLTPWGNISGNQAFKGTFDGQGHSVSGIYFCPTQTTATGLFGNPGEKSAEIKNLKITNSLVVAKDKYSGALFGSAKADISLSNLYIDIDLRTDFSYCGGMIGYYTSGTTHIDSCVYAGTIQAKSGMKEIGGLIGCYGSGSLKISNCAFLGRVSGEAERVGGMVGGVYKDLLSVANSVSMGSMTSSAASVGAFVGYTGKPICLTNNLYTQTHAPVYTVTGGAVSSETSAPIATAVNEEALIGAGAMSTLAAHGFLNWKATEGMTVLPGSVASMMTVSTPVTPFASTQFVGYQIGKGEAENTVHLRLVAVVDSSDYESVGFSVTMENDRLGTKSYANTTRSVYHKLIGYGEDQERIDYTAESLGGKYIYALNIKNIPVTVEHGVYRFSVSTYHVTDGEAIPDGEAKSFHLDGSRWREG